MDAFRLVRLSEIVQNLQPGEIKNKVDPVRLAGLAAEGAVAPAAHEIIEYWGGLTIAGLLLMPPTRHSFIHLNEALRVRQKLR